MSHSRLTTNDIEILKYSNLEILKSICHDKKLFQNRLAKYHPR